MTRVEELIGTAKALKVSVRIENPGGTNLSTSKIQIGSVEITAAEAKELLELVNQAINRAEQLAHGLDRMLGKGLDARGRP